MLPGMKQRISFLPLKYHVQTIVRPARFSSVIRASPGTTWEYSMAVDVLGRVVEAISGERLSAFLDERLFRPLNMVDTGFKVLQSLT
jgi:CubicO group peptidase (beta-lactamase class C family)